MEKRLAELRYGEILLDTTREDLEKIVFDRKTEQLPKKCDVGIVLGGISMIPHRVEHAARLYHNGEIEIIALSGGIGYLNLNRTTPEAFKMKRYLLERDVPEYAILVEPDSKNTFQNIRNTIKLLEGDYDLSRTDIALVTSDFHERRALGIMRRELPGGHIYGSGVHDGLTDIDNWHKSLFGKRMIMQEALLLSNYAKDNKIDNTTITGLTLARRRRPR